MRNRNAFDYLIVLARERCWLRLGLFAAAVTVPLAIGYLVETVAPVPEAPGQWIGTGGLIALAVLAVGPTLFGKRPRSLMMAVAVWLSLIVLLVFLWPLAVGSSIAVVEWTAVLLLLSAFLVWIVYWIRRNAVTTGSVSVRFIVLSAAFTIGMALWILSEVLVLDAESGVGFVQASDLFPTPWLYPLLLGIVELWIASTEAQAGQAPETYDSADSGDVAEPPEAVPGRSERIARYAGHLFYVLLGIGCLVSLGGLFVPGLRYLLHPLGGGLIAAAFIQFILGLALAAYVSKRDRSK